jgi:phage virion morphogenesis protein
MANLRVEFTIADADRYIQGLENRLGDLTPAMKAVGEYMLLRTRERFDDEVDPSGQRWQALAPKTIRSKEWRKKNPGKGAKVRAAPDAILQSSFLLRDTIAYNADSISVRVGTPQEYGVYHQFGTARIPQREFLGVDAEDLAEIDSIVTDYLTS